jgi:hypothetical protein
MHETVTAAEVLSATATCIYSDGYRGQQCVAYVPGTYCRYGGMVGECMVRHWPRVNSADHYIARSLPTESRSQSRDGQEGERKCLVQNYNNLKLLSSRQLHNKYPLCIPFDGSVFFFIPGVFNCATISKLLHHCQRGRNDKSCCRLLTISD